MQTHHENIGRRLQPPFSSEFEKAGEDELVHFSATETCLQNLGQMILFLFFKCSITMSRFYFLRVEKTIFETEIQSYNSRIYQSSSIIADLPSLG